MNMHEQANVYSVYSNIGIRNKTPLTFILKGVSYQLMN